MVKAKDGAEQFGRKARNRERAVAGRVGETYPNTRARNAGGLEELATELNPAPGAERTGGKRTRARRTGGGYDAEKG